MKKRLEISGTMMYNFAAELQKPYRSITGEGVRETLKIVQQELPITIHEIPSGTKVFDWTVPREWNIRDAYILGPNGTKIIDFKKNYLHVVGYSTPINAVMPLKELQEHLYSIPEQPDAIPYITSYYEERWGFCMSDRARRYLKKGTYRVVIDSSFSDGSLTYGDIVIRGETKEEVLLSTYVCHPQMANDNISGITMAVHLAKWLMQEKRRYTYRIVFIPETIGSLAYMSKNLKRMKARTIAGFNLTCVGDERAYSFMPSRRGDALSDRVALHVLRHRHPDFKTYSYLTRGSDERQYCSPGADLPVSTIMRSRYGSFPEYHTSLDTLDFVTPQGLFGTFEVYADCIEAIENNHIYVSTVIGEPQFGRRGLFRTITGKAPLTRADLYLNNLMGHADGTRDLIGIAETIGAPVTDLVPITERLVDAGLLKIIYKRRKKK